jgi:hypothetical protein
VDLVHRSTVDRIKGVRPLLIWTARRDRTAQVYQERQRRREAAGRGGARRRRSPE